MFKSVEVPIILIILTGALFWLSFEVDKTILNEIGTNIDRQQMLKMKIPESYDQCFTDLAIKYDQSIYKAINALSKTIYGLGFLSLSALIMSLCGLYARYKKST